MYLKVITAFNLVFMIWQTNGRIDHIGNNAAFNDIERRYEANWTSLDKRPLPQWYDDAKFGIFVHWGVYSVPSFGSEWFWWFWKGMNSSNYVDFMTNNYKPDFSYQDFAQDFTAEFFKASEWADIFYKSGAKYVVLTTKHHEGYTLWPSKHSFGWNSVDVGPHIDIVGELSKAVKKKNMKFGVYHSLFEWFNPLWVADKSNNFKTNDFVVSKTLPELYELVENYEPDIVWSDGEAEATDEYWNSTTFIAWLYNSSPVKETVVVNDRWGININCRHGDFYTCGDRFNPGVLQEHKWENCLTIDKKSWGFRRNAKLEDFMTMEELISEIAVTVSCGGNILLNVGPTKYGIIEPIYEERLLGIGQWLGVNGDAIFKTIPWRTQNDTESSNVWYTKNADKNIVYAIVLNWPLEDTINLEYHEDLYNDDTKIEMLGVGELNWDVLNHKVMIQFPAKSAVKNDWAWVLKIENFK